MTFTEEQVREEIKKIATTFGLDPILIMAIAEQECFRAGKTYRADVPRLEQNYMTRYYRGKLEFSAPEKVLLSSSFGVMQEMGGSLLEDGFFDWFKENVRLDGIYFALEGFCDRLDWQIHWGCVHFLRKLKSANMDIRQALLKWNGGGNPKYDDEVLERLARIERELNNV